VRYGKRGAVGVGREFWNRLNFLMLCFAFSYICILRMVVLHEINMKIVIANDVFLIIYKSFLKTHFYVIF
jgi:hypothetical protein